MRGSRLLLALGAGLVLACISAASILTFSERFVARCIRPPNVPEGQFWSCFTFPVWHRVLGVLVPEDVVHQLPA